MMSSVSAKYLLDHFHPHLQSPWLTKTFEVETTQVFTLPVEYIVRIIDFRSYLNIIVLILCNTLHT